MTYKFEIINRSLVITDTNTNKPVLDQPKRNLYYNVKYLLNDDEEVVIQDLQLANKDIVLFKRKLSECVDATDTPFTQSTFSEFVRNNLGTRKE